MRFNTLLYDNWREYIEVNIEQSLKQAESFLE